MGTVKAGTFEELRYVTSDLAKLIDRGVLRPIRELGDNCNFTYLLHRNHLAPIYGIGFSPVGDKGKIVGTPMFALEELVDPEKKVNDIRLKDLVRVKRFGLRYVRTNKHYEYHGKEKREAYNGRENQFKIIEELLGFNDFSQNPSFLHLNVLVDPEDCLGFFDSKKALEYLITEGDTKLVKTALDFVKSEFGLQDDNIGVTGSTQMGDTDLIDLTKGVFEDIDLILYITPEKAVEIRNKITANTSKHFESMVLDHGMYWPMRVMVHYNRNKNSMSFERQHKDDEQVMFCLFPEYIRQNPIKRIYDLSGQLVILEAAKIVDDTYSYFMPPMFRLETGELIICYDGRERGHNFKGNIVSIKDAIPAKVDLEFNGSITSERCYIVSNSIQLKNFIEEDGKYIPSPFEMPVFNEKGVVIKVEDMNPTLYARNILKKHSYKLNELCRRFTAQKTK